MTSKTVLPVRSRCTRRPRWCPICAQGPPVTSTANSQITYTLDQNGNLTSDGLRLFEYDGQNGLATVKISQSAEASKISYLHNALGQRVFKSEPLVDHVVSQASTLGSAFVYWLQTNFGWLFAQAQANATLGQSYVYSDNNLGSTPVLLGEYGNGGNNSGGRKEYLWLPVNGQAMPIGLHANATLYAVHADHLNTPRKVISAAQGTVWQWPYSAFGDEKPVSLLRPAFVTPYVFDNATSTALSNVMGSGSVPQDGLLNLRYPGQYFDEESNLNYNYFRSYQPSQGRYPQPDPIGLAGGSNRFAYVEGNPLSNIDPLGLETYVCKRPLGGTPGSYAPPLLNHTYVCVGSGANMTCGSTTASSGGALRNILTGSPGKPTTSITDYYKPEACERRQGEDSCIETCIANELKKPTRPKYAVGPAGTDCQEYTEDVVSTCERRCVRR